MFIKAYVTGLKETQAALAAIEPGVRHSVQRTILKLAIDLQRKVVKEKLSGNPLHRRTGDLSRSVYATTTDDGLTGIVGANTPYAAYQEYGFKGRVDVRAHMRRTQVQMMQAKYNKKGEETRASKARRMGTGTISVRARQVDADKKSGGRNIDYPAHSYLRSALDEMRGTIAEQIMRTSKGAAKDAFKS